MRAALLVLAAVLCLLPSCATYTVKDGLEAIDEPSWSYLPPTKHSEIQALSAAEAELAARAAAEEAARLEEIARQEAEKLQQEQAEADRLAAEEAARQAEAARQEAERLAREAEEAARAEAEAEALRQAQEAMRAGIEAARRLNNYPDDLSQITYPHVYQPVAEPSLLSDSFTRVDVVLVALPDSAMTEEEIAPVAASLKDAGFEFIVTTGPVESQVAMARALGMDAVTVPEGTISHASECLGANGSVVSFRISENKTIDVIVADVHDAMAEADNLDVPAWMEYLDGSSEERIAEIEAETANSSDTEKILALHSAEPSTLDWSIFTPYSYRADHDWAVSDHLSAQGWSDTWRATHFSEETDPGVTLATSSIHERLSFLMSQGLMEVSSSTITLPGLSEGDTARFAVAATYIVP